MPAIKRVEDIFCFCGVLFRTSYRLSFMHYKILEIVSTYNAIITPPFWKKKTTTHFFRLIYPHKGRPCPASSNLYFWLCFNRGFAQVLDIIDERYAETRWMIFGAQGGMKFLSFNLLWSFQSSSIDSHPSPFCSGPPSGSLSSSDSSLSSRTPTNLSLISPSTGVTLSANARRTAGLVDVSYTKNVRTNTRNSSYRRKYLPKPEQLLCCLQPII